MSPEELQGWVDYLTPLVGSAILGVIILIAGWIAAGWARGLTQKACERAKLPSELAIFLGKMIRYVIIAATVISALSRVGIETTSLVAVFASAGLAVGLALQGSLSNFASGVMILFFQPFRIGNRITAGGHTGVVEEIGIFTTTMSTPNNEVIIVPNSQVMGGSITNHTTRGVIRGQVEVGVAYGVDIKHAMAVCQVAAANAELVKQDPAPAVAFVNLGASSLDLVVHVWSDAADYLAMLHNVRVAVYEGLNAAGVEIPFSQIVVHQAPTE